MFETSSDEPVSLSAETLAALKAFALQSGVAIEEENVISSVRQHFDIQDKGEIFSNTFRSCDGKKSISFNVKGVKRELGQTLNSTGLTMYDWKILLCLRP